MRARLLLLSIALATGCHLVTGELVQSPPLVIGRDGITNGNGIDLGVRVVGPSQTPGLVAVSLVTWPELELVRSRTTADPSWTGAMDVEHTVEPESPLEARWYAVVVDVAPRGRVDVVSDHVPLGDGGYAFRVFGTSSPRIHSARIANRPSGSSVSIALTEDIELPTAAIPIDVTVDDTACTFEGGSARNLTFACTALDPSRGRVEILEPIPSPGGAPLEPHVIVVTRPWGYELPIE